MSIMAFFVGMPFFPSLWQHLPSVFNSLSLFASLLLGLGSEGPVKSILSYQVFGSFSNKTRVLALQ